MRASCLKRCAFLLMGGWLAAFTGVTAWGQVRAAHERQEPGHTAATGDGLYSVDMPDLVGYYHGFLGETHTGEFDFGHAFLEVQDAWVHVVGLADVSTGGASGLKFHGYLDGVRGPDLVLPPVVQFDVNVPLTPSTSILDGSGEVVLSIVVAECCDHRAQVTEATLWFQGSSDAVIGACCDLDDCSETTQDQCQASGTGRYLGDWSTCDGDPDGDGVVGCDDVCPDVSAPGGVDSVGRPLGDVDADCHVDLADYAIMERNFTGP